MLHNTISLKKAVISDRVVLVVNKNNFFLKGCRTEFHVHCFNILSPHSSQRRVCLASFGCNKSLHCDKVIGRMALRPVCLSVSALVFLSVFSLHLCLLLYLSPPTLPLSSQLVQHIHSLVQEQFVGKLFSFLQNVITIIGRYVHFSILA